MIEQVYLYLILTGGTIGVVLLYLWRQGRNASDIGLGLIRLNEQLNFDTPAFLRAAWPLLAQSGLRGLSWQLNWYGVAVQGEAGKLTGKTLYREIQVSEMKLALTLFQKKTRGEQRYFDEALIETFMLLLSTDMWIKAGATNATFAQMAKLNLFLQHDMKNVAQFIQLMADQLADIPDGKEKQVLDHLRAAAPLIRHRADRIVRTLMVGELPPEPPHLLPLRSKLIQLCELYRLDHEITGDAEIRVPENTLDSALDNIIKNYSDIALRHQDVRPRLSIGIAISDQVVNITIEAFNTPTVAQHERLFEPFWSSDPSGLGIGLYQAKQMLENCLGSLTINKMDAGRLQFQVSIPITK